MSNLCLLAFKLHYKGYLLVCGLLQKKFCIVNLVGSLIIHMWSMSLLVLGRILLRCGTLRAICLQACLMRGAP